MDNTHNIIILILDCRVFDGCLGTEFFEVFRQFYRPEYGHVWFRCCPDVVQGV